MQKRPQVRSRPRPRSRLRALSQFEHLEARELLATVPYGALTNDTAEYMLGDVRVSVVFLESSAVNSSNTETWTPSTIAAAKSKVAIGLNWWVDTLHAYYPDAYLNFDIDFTHADTPFEVNSEPINQTSNAHVQWVQAFLTQQGYWNNGDIHQSIYAYNHAQRVANDANWSFTIFMVNDTNDLDDQFAAGGSFSRAFAYGGGRYLVTLASRPASTIAHETGHIFWADDEYAGGDSYLDQRGYYNQQNTNAEMNPTPGFVPQDSIMSGGDPLSRSYNSHTLPASTRAMIGWRDSDSDGIIDVLDVPLTLTGDGYRTAQGTYRFVGKSQVQTLPNLNSQSNNRSDVTINRIRLAEYRIDGGAWLTAATYDTYEADLDLTIPLPNGAQTIEIRTRDTTTGVTSATFLASTAQPTSLTPSGISGFVFNDTNGNGVWDTSEGVVSSRQVQLVTPAGAPVAGPMLINPDVHPVGTQIRNAFAGVTLTTQGSLAASPAVYVRNASANITTSRVFGNHVDGAQGDEPTALWEKELRLRIEFDTLVSYVSIDAIGSAAGSYGRLEIYDSSNVLIGRYTTQELALGGVETMKLGRNAADIKYAIAYGNGRTKVALDNLQVGAAVVTTTNAQGGFSLPYLPAGTYYVKADLPAEWENSNPTSGIRTVQVVSNVATAAIHFGQHADYPLWQNQQDRYDVNSDRSVTPLDALLVIIDLNSLGPRYLSDSPPTGESPPNFIDVDGDGAATPSDALAIIIYLNSRGTGEAPQLQATGTGGGSTSPSQGEELASLAADSAPSLWSEASTITVSAAALIPVSEPSPTEVELAADVPQVFEPELAFAHSALTYAWVSESAVPFSIAAGAIARTTSQRRVDDPLWECDGELWDLLAADLAAHRNLA